MRTLTLKINDDYFDKFVAFLELLPKKTVIIEEDKKQKELNIIQNEIKEAMNDVELGHSKILRVIK